MGKLVNVVLSDGKVVAVPEEDAARLSGASIAQPETDQAAVARAVGAANEERASGFGQGVKAVVEGAADALTGGLYGKAAGNVSADYAEDLANRGTYRPGMRAVGEIGSFLLPVGLPGLAAKTGQAVTAGLAARSVSPLTRGASFGAAAAGRAVEGGIVGLGGHVATTNVTGDPLTIEGALVNMGVGSVLNVGIGAAADKVRSTGVKAKGVAAEAAETKAEVATAKEGEALFSKPRDSWEGFKESVKSIADTEKQAVTAEKKASEEYQKFVGSSKKIDGAIRQAEKARNEIQARLNQTKYGKAITETGEALGEASEQLGKLKDKAAKLTESSEDWPRTMKSVDDAISEVRGRYAPKGAEEPLYKPKLEGYTGSFDERGNFDRDQAFHSARTKKMPISEKLDKDLAEFSARASRIRQMRQGGYKMKGGRWVADASAPPNPEGALAELQQLRTDFTKRFGGVKFPDLPAVPKVEAPIGGVARAADGPAGQMDEVRQLSRISRELSDGIQSARAKFKAGDKEGAAEELRMLQERAAAAGQGDLVLPQIPRKAAPVEASPPVRIPKDLLELARMEALTVERLSALVAKDARAAAEFEKLAVELGANAADGVAGLHAKLGTYITAEQKLLAKARKEAEDEAAGGLLAVLRRGSKKFVRYGAARAADTYMGGGFMGAGARVVAGEGSFAAMNAAEDLISGSLMQGKLGIKQAVANIIGKVAGPTARGLDELGPITAYLQTHILTGKQDEGDDESELALKRIQDSLSLATTANDAAYLAVQALLGHESDAGFKLHQKLVGDIQHLAETAPKDPGIAMHGLKSDWTPSPDQAIGYAYRIEAVTNPLKAIERTIAGDGHPDAVETLWLRWPALMQAVAEEFSFALHDMGEMSYELASNFSSLFRTPITGLMDPTVTMEIQSLYLPKPEESAPASSGGTGRSVGRPAAVNSSVAGSSVSGLISQ